MKIIYIIHGWDGNPNSEPWFDWLKNEGRLLGYEVIIPKMPNTSSPKINEWVEKLNEIVNIHEEIYFVGHSIGCQAIMRYLEKSPINSKVKGCIFIAGWFDLLETAYETEEEKEIAKSWINSIINLGNIKNNESHFNETKQIQEILDFIKDN